MATQTDIFSLLLAAHITSGAVSLMSAAIAILSKSIDTKHKWHIYSGKLYCYGMTGIFITAIPMSILNPNMFLFLIAIFSYYLTVAGWRYAINRKGTARIIDWLTAVIMFITSIMMLLYGLRMLIATDFQGITMMLFGGIGMTLSWTDLLSLKRGGMRGKNRITSHLTSMMAATIATLTAVIVTVWEFQPEFVLWIAPTLVVTPIIIWWNRRIKKGVRPKGMS